MNGVVTKQYASLGGRNEFNKTLRHLVNVTMMAEEVAKGKNPADLINDALDGQSITREQITPILSVLLTEKLKLPVRSHNMDESFSSFASLTKIFSRWNGVDLVLLYHHPNLGILVGNPANEDHWESFPELKKDELVVAYARSRKDDPEVARRALDAFFEALSGREPREDPGFILDLPRTEPSVQAQPVVSTGSPAAPAPSPAPAAQGGTPAPAESRPKKGGKRNYSPRYSVQVTNELFHNGNVEAWKNIIESYQVKTSNRVIVYHEGELIQDLNSLFKWGKVKHGGVIHFQVMGEEIKMVSRLQKYLYEGASARFESFLKKDVSKVLNIF